jgi:hypothetical protein
VGSLRRRSMLPLSMAVQVLPGFLVLPLTEVAGGDLHGVLADNALCGVWALHQLLLLLFARRLVGWGISVVQIQSAALRSVLLPTTTFLADVVLSLVPHRTIRVGSTRAIAT